MSTNLQRLDNQMQNLNIKPSLKNDMTTICSYYRDLQRTYLYAAPQVVFVRMYKK